MDLFQHLHVKKISSLKHECCTVDPFGDDYFCTLCHQELGNTYMHCSGCEALLAKDFNICVQCHSSKDKVWMCHQMHPML